jgi:phage baseplate assembly protein W
MSDIIPPDLTARARGWRLAATRIGDTIQDVAVRELGRADRWPELVAYNRLAPPYIVDNLGGLEDGQSENGRVLIAGQTIRIPAGRPASGVSDPEDIYGTDAALPGGRLEAGEDGDLARLADVPNLRQALEHRLATEEGELVWHPTYGNPVLAMRGERASAVNLLLAQAYAERTIRSDPRIASVPEVEAEAVGDAFGVTATAVATDGRPLPVGGADTE